MAVLCSCDWQLLTRRHLKEWKKDFSWPPGFDWREQMDTYLVRLVLTLDIEYIGNAELCWPGWVTHHAVQRLPLRVTLRLPHIAHVCGAGAVGLVLGLRLASPAQLRLPEDLRGGAATLRYASGHQSLVPAVQERRGARGHVHLWLHCVKQSQKKKKGSEKSREGEKRKMTTWRKD